MVAVKTSPRMLQTTHAVRSLSSHGGAAT
jgi:hypothetical protein